MGKDFYPPVEGEDKYNKGDIFSYGRKKSKETGAGKSTREYIKARAKHYRQNGVGFGISMMGDAGTGKKYGKKKFGKKGWRS